MPLELPGTTEKEAVAPNPFWSARAQAELELQRVRPSDLDEQARRIESSLDPSGDRCPKEDTRHRREVRLDDEIMEPQYSPQGIGRPQAEGQIQNPDRQGKG